MNKKAKNTSEDRLKKIKNNLEELSDRLQDEKQKKNKTLVVKTLNLINKQLGPFEQKNKPPSRGGFNNPTRISEEFCDFLKLKDPEVKLSRDEGTTAVNVYIHKDPLKVDEKHTKWHYLNEENRNLRKGKVIEPDDKLSKLLDYEEWKERVKRGEEKRKMAFNVFKKATERGENIEVLGEEGIDKNKKMIIRVTDMSLYDWVVQKLITKHFLSNKKIDLVEK